MPLHCFAFAAIPTGTVCGDGYILEPERDTPDYVRGCIPIPENLKTAVDGTELKAGATTWPSDCPRFDITLGCIPVVLPQSCVWSWLSQNCDALDDGSGAGPPGKIYYDACSAGPDIQCQTWDMFGKAHPSYNCEATEKCPDPFDCISMSGALTMMVSNIDKVADNGELFVNGLKNGIQSVAPGVEEFNIYLTDDQQILPSSFGGGWRRLAASLGDFFVVNYKILSLPYTVFPGVVLNSSAAILSAANAFFENSTNSTNSSNATANASAPFSILSMEFVNNTVATLDEIQGTGDGGDGPDGGDFGDDGGFGDGDFGDGGFGDGPDGGDGFDGGDGPDGDGTPPGDDDGSDP
ncbi:unnamed protein product, partial [Symbiodinium natans]